jgi:two-component system, cell cycle sensor histidine kinase and response regulator CckA
MSERSEEETTRSALRERIIGLGGRSIRKSYYPALKERVAELERFRALLDQTTDAIFLLQAPSGRVVDVNESACVRLGIPRKELLGLPLGALWEGPVADCIQRLMENACSESEQEIVEAEACTRGGECFPVEVTVRLVHFHGSDYVVAVARDITERKRSEAELERWLSLLRSAIESTADGILIVDSDGAVLLCNKRFEDLWRVSSGWMNLASPEERLVFLMGQTKDADGFVQRVRQLYSLPDEEAYDVLELDDGRIFDRCSLPFRVGNTIAGRVWCFRDTTERHKAERMLLQTERIKAVADMASGVAHNFNNLLQLVIGRAEMALTQIAAGAFSKVEANLHQVLEGSKLGAQTVRRLQDFARCRTLDPTVDGTIMDLSLIIRDAVEMSKPWWKSAAEKQGVRISIDQDLLPGCYVLGNENELFEVVVNLVKNATEALPEGGLIAIGSFVDGTGAGFRIRDNGIGIKKCDLDRVFDPFWTTKGSEGTGLGLASSYGIVRRHGGSISVTCREEEGTVFTVRLPLAAEPSARARPSTEGKAPGALRILLIDDAEPVLDLLAEALREKGQIVLSATSGRAGIEIFRENDIDVVVCDLGMPLMNGWEVAGTIREICRQKGIPRKPFLLLTGWGGQMEELDRIAESGVDRVIEKPVAVPCLLSTIRDAVRQGAQESTEAK